MSYTRREMVESIATALVGAGVAKFTHLQPLTDDEPPTVEVDFSELKIHGGTYLEDFPAVHNALVDKVEEIFKRLAAAK